MKRKSWICLMLVMCLVTVVAPKMMLQAGATSGMTTSLKNGRGNEFAIFPLEGDFHVTQKWYTGSHSNQIAIDCLPLTAQGGINYSAKIYAPFTGKIVASYPSWGCVVFQSNDPVQYADGTVDRMTVK